LCDGTKEDWDRISQAMKPFIVELPDRVLAHLKMLQGDCGGFAIDRLEHCLQTATRAHRDGRDEEVRCVRTAARHGRHPRSAQSR
jgi:predicted HD phosphohydrolase